MSTDPCLTDLVVSKLYRNYTMTIPKTLKQTCDITFFQQ